MAVKLGIIAEVHNKLELTVTGTLDPDCSGDYVMDGRYNGYPAWRRSDSSYWIWFNSTTSVWTLSATKGYEGHERWGKSGSQYGDYQPDAGVSGVATFAISGTEPVATIWGEGEWRWYSNAPVRMKVFAVEMEAQGADLVADLADIVDGGGDAAKLAEIVAALEDNYSGDRHYIWGNHEAYIWQTDWTDYIAVISQTPTGLVSSWATGKPAGYPVTTAYSFDKGGIHFVIMALRPYPTWSEAEQAALNTWLDTDLAATTLPIVVLTHHHLDDASGLGWGATYDDCETIQTTLANYNVQAVISSHMHQVPRLCDFITYPIGADTPFYHLRGNCIGPMDGSIPDTDLGKDGASYLFEINPDAVGGTTHARARINVTCYYTPVEAENQVDAMDREPKYAAM